MRKQVLPIVLLLAVTAAAVHAQSTARDRAWLDPHMEPAARLLGEALSSRFAWERLAELGDTFGPRLSGSQALEDAIDWAVEQMKKDGLENVRKEPVKVPHWVRGSESLEIVHLQLRHLPPNAAGERQQHPLLADTVTDGWARR